jgi:hypothetical protein
MERYEVERDRFSTMYSGDLEVGELHTVVRVDELVAWLREQAGGPPAGVSVEECADWIEANLS